MSKRICDVSTSFINSSRQSSEQSFSRVVRWGLRHLLVFELDSLRFRLFASRGVILVTDLGISTRRREQVPEVLRARLGSEVISSG